MQRTSYRKQLLAPDRLAERIAVAAGIRRSRDRSVAARLYSAGLESANEGTPSPPFEKTARHYKTSFGGRPRRTGIDAWFAMAIDKDYETARQLALEALAHSGPDRFALLTLTELSAASGAIEDAAEFAASLVHAFPTIAWFRIRLADLLAEAKKLERAIEVLEPLSTDQVVRRHALKRLARFACAAEDVENALRWQEELVALAPNYLVYASDYLLLAALRQLQGNSHRGAIDAVEAGLRIYRKTQTLITAREALRTGEFDAESTVAASGWPRAEGSPNSWKRQPRRVSVPEVEGEVERVPISTPIVTMHSDLLSVIDAATSSVRSPEDVVAVSESVLAISQGRAIPLELIDAGPIARFLCRFVKPAGPLHSPEGMQGAIAESTAIRVLFAATVAGVGKAFGISGLFYRLAGRHTAMIDDVAACMPPHDHHLILAPAHPDLFCEAARTKLSCRVCVVDANNQTGAWVVGASRGVDPKVVEACLSDNPAGNEDEQTPVVLIRGIPWAE
jgi:tetratricopeptide (TPR) repeat protein